MADKKIKLAINGFGRIGRSFFQVAFLRPEFEIVAVNDLGDVNNLAYLLQYDSVYKKYEKEVKAEPGNIIVDGKKIKFVQEKDPTKLPWKDLGVDVVIESTGVFTSYEKAKTHLDAGAKRVVITAPAKNGGPTVTATPGINEENLKNCPITSNASCTTNAITPVLAVMNENPGIIKSAMSTVHGYTAMQSLVDAPAAKDWRRGRAAAQNIVPSTTGAADAVAAVMPEMKGIFDGVSIRVPIISGSIADITFLAKRKTTKEEINEIFREAAKNPRWQKVLKVIDIPIVSADILKEPFGAIVDLTLTRVIDGDLVKVFSWYDNEYGYSVMLSEHVLCVGKFL